jgi:hypothetical protein
MQNPINKAALAKRAFAHNGLLGLQRYEAIL